MAGYQFRSESESFKFFYIRSYTRNANIQRINSIAVKMNRSSYAIIKRSNKDHLLRRLFSNKVYVIIIWNNVLITNDLFLHSFFYVFIFVLYVNHSKMEYKLTKAKCDI